MIITVMSADFSILGSNLISYAAESNNLTNNKNIEFSTYFKNSKEEKVEKAVRVLGRLQMGVYSRNHRVDLSCNRKHYKIVTSILKIQFYQTQLQVLMETQLI